MQKNKIKQLISYKVRNLSEAGKAQGFDRAWRHCPPRASSEQARRKYGFSGVYSPKDSFIRKPCKRLLFIDSFQVSFGTLKTAGGILLPGYA